MKILQITGSLAIGGLEQVAVQIQRYAPTDWQFDYLVYHEQQGYREEVTERGGRIFQIAHSRWQLPRFLWQVYQLLRQEHYDVVHIHTFTSSGYLARIAKMAGVPQVVVHSHTTGAQKQSWIRSLYLHLMRRWIYRYSDTRLAVNQAAGEALYGHEKTEYQIVPNGIELDVYKYQPESRQLVRQQLGISAMAHVMGTVGRLAPEKNQVFLVELLALMRQENPELDAHLIIVGPDCGCEYLIRQKIKQLNLDDWVYLLGHQSASQVGNILSAFDVFALPSEYEGAPLVIAEALANGLPVVCSDRVTISFPQSEQITQLKLTNYYNWITNILTMKRIEAEDNCLRCYDVKTNITKILNNYQANQK